METDIQIKALRPIARLKILDDVSMRSEKDNKSDDQWGLTARRPALGSRKVFFKMARLKAGAMV